MNIIINTIINNIMPNQNTPITFENSFASQERAKFWHPTKNGDLMPKNFTIKSGKKCCFKCDKCKHDFDSTPRGIYKGSWCPYCSIPSKKLCEDETCKHCLDKSFASHEKAENWHPTKNNKNPREVLKGSSQNYWFTCSNCEHDYDMLLPNVVKNQGCPYCSGRRRCNDKNCKHCFENSFASHEKSKFWHPIKNGNTKPRDVATSCDSKYCFKCGNCQHDFYISLSNIKAGCWCSYCCNPCHKLCEDESCEHCFNNSFASNEKSKFWHPTKNDNIKPRDLVKGSQTFCWFKCDDCNHDFETRLDYVHRGGWCPYCCYPCRKLCNKNNCKHCFDNSFASNEKSKFWHPTKNTKTPRDILKGSNQKYWFKCCNCKHDFETTLYQVKQGGWCPYCCYPCKKICKDKNCKHCFENSFASHEKSKFWHTTKNGNIKSRDMIKGGEIPCWFKCEYNHDFKSNPYRVSSGKWCPICVNKTEKKLLEFLNKHYPNKIVFQPKYEWCKNTDTNRYLPFDFEVFRNIIIELDGDQHIDKQISNWSNLEEIQERDMYKMEQAINNGKHIIRIRQIDVWNDKNNWQEELKKNIDLLENDNDTKIRCIGHCDIYNEYTII